MTCFLATGERHRSHERIKWRTCETMGVIIDSNQQYGVHVFDISLLTVMGARRILAFCHFVFVCFVFPHISYPECVVLAVVLCIDARLTSRIFPHSAERSETLELKESNMMRHLSKHTTRPRIYTPKKRKTPKEFELIK